MAALQDLFNGSKNEFQLSPLVLLSIMMCVGSLTLLEAYVKVIRYPLIYSLFMEVLMRALPKELRKKKLGIGIKIAPK